MTTETTIPAGGIVIGFTVPFQRIADIVGTAIEQPVGDWLQRATVLCDGIERKGLKRQPWYTQAAYWSQSKAALVCTVDRPTNDHPGEKTLTLPDFQRALVLLATKDNGAYAHHLGDFLKEQDDAATADIFMQMAVYGEEVYA